MSDTRKFVLSLIEESIANCEAALALLKHTLQEDAYVVLVQDLAVSFHREDGHRVLGQPFICPAANCVRFPKEKAEQLAALMQNGNGATGRAVHVVEAINAELAHHRKAYAALSSQ